MPGKLLLVDDDRFILNALTKLLAAQGYHCSTAVTSDEAWRLIESEPFDLILLDVMLPSLSGFQVARQLKFDITTQHIPIVMLTARSDAQSMMAGIERGADVYLTKPIDFPELLRSIETCLRHSAMPARRPPPDE